MPITYPPAAPTLTGDVETINRFLNTPTLVQRRLRTLAENRFIADSLLTNKVDPGGGAIVYEQNETIFPDQVAQSVAPGAEFPLSGISLGTALVAAVTKWGLDTLVTDEAVDRMKMDPVNRALMKLVNGVVKQVDSIAMTAINTAITQTSAAAGTWNNSTTLVREITAAVAAIHALNQGYEPDTLIVSDTVGGYLVGNATVASLLPRESWNQSNGPIFTGRLGSLLGLDIFVSPNLPTPTSAYIVDRKVLGGMAEEKPLQSKSIRQEVRERWRLRAKRVVVPFVQEPNAGWKITGAG